MALVIGPALATAALLGLAGAQKLLDPTMTVGALGALGLPASPNLVRAGSAAEVALAVAAMAFGGPMLWALVAVSYAAFAGFVLLSLRRGTMIGSCGCFGREDTPPHALHVAANAAMAAVAVGAAATLAESPIAALGRAGVASAAGVVALATLAVYLLHAVYVQLPRTLRASGLRS